jgi:Flagellar hook-length control protein FliK
VTPSINKLVFSCGIALALLLGRMVINGVYQRPDVQLAEGQDGPAAAAPGVATGDFSALLFMVLNSSRLAATPLAANSEWNTVPESAAVETTGDFTPSAAANFFGAHDSILDSAATPTSTDTTDFVAERVEAAARVLLARPNIDSPASFLLAGVTGTEVTEASESRVSEDHPGEFHDKFTGMLAETGTQLQAPVCDDQRSAKPLDRDNESFRAVATVGLVPESEGSAAQATIFEPVVTDIGIFQAAVAAGAPLDFPVAVDEATMKGPIEQEAPFPGAPALHLSATDAESRAMKTIPVESADADASESREFYTLLQELPTHGGGVREAAAWKSGHGLSVLPDRGLPMDTQSQSQSTSWPGAAALSSGAGSGSEMSLTESDQKEQGDFSRKRQPEQARELADPAFSVQRHDFVPGHASRVIQGTPQAPERDVHWRPLIDHVAGEINGHVRIGKSEAVIQLDPPELGKLRIDLLLDGDKLEARIQAENPDAGNLLETHLPELRQALAESRIEQVEVRFETATWSGARGDSRQSEQQQARARPEANPDRDRLREGSEASEWLRQEDAVRRSGRVSMWA